jgi:hypothetical protein
MDEKYLEPKEAYKFFKDSIDLIEFDICKNIKNYFERLKEQVDLVYMEVVKMVDEKEKNV